MAHASGCDQSARTMCPSRACRHARPASLPGNRQWRRIYSQEGKVLDRGCWRQNCFHHPWLTPLGTSPCNALSGSAWENGYCDDFNAHFRPPQGLHANRCRATDELLNGEVFYTLREAQILIERWRHHYNFASLRPSFYVVEENKFC